MASLSVHAAHVCRLVPNTRVLIVEDDASVRRLLTDALSAEGYEIVTACDGRSALRVLFDEWRGADIVVTDEHLPNLSGLAIAGQLRKRPGWLPVVVVSPCVTDDLKERARRLGISGVFPMPLSMPALLDAVRMVAPIAF